MPKVLIGVPTYAGHAHCREELVGFLHEADKDPDVDVLIVWNGEADPWGFEDFEVQHLDGFDIDLNKALGENQSALQGILVKKQNLLRQRVLDGGYSHLLHIESDVIPPSDALKRLLRHNVDLATGIYFVRAAQHMVVKMEGNEFFERRLEELGKTADTLFYSRVACLPAIWGYQSTSLGGFDAPRLGHRIWTIEDWIDQRLKRKALVPIAASGVGCMLISRKVLEEVVFVSGAGKKGLTAGLTDYIFCSNAAQKGFQLFADPDLVCQHFSTEIAEDQHAKREFVQNFEWEKDKMESLKSLSEITPLEALNALFNMARRTDNIEEIELAIKCYRDVKAVLPAPPEKGKQEIATGVALKD